MSDVVPGQYSDPTNPLQERPGDGSNGAAFPYLIKVTTYSGSNKEPFLAEVVVVRGKNTWKRFFVNGLSIESSHFHEGERWEFNDRQTAIDALTGLGSSPLAINFTENASDAQIEKALQELQDSRPELKQPQK